ncbi:hypothetical protein PAENIP36_17230 [Paenibacillus sp. P36]
MLLVEADAADAGGAGIRLFIVTLTRMAAETMICLDRVIVISSKLLDCVSHGITWIVLIVSAQAPSDHEEILEYL